MLALLSLCFRLRVGVRVRDGVGFRVTDRVGIRDRVRASCGFNYLCFGSSTLEIKIYPCGEKQVQRIE